MKIDTNTNKDDGALGPGVGGCDLVSISSNIVRAALWRGERNIISDRQMALSKISYIDIQDQVCAVALEFASIRDELQSRNTGSPTQYTIATTD